MFTSLKSRINFELSKGSFSSQHHVRRFAVRVALLCWMVGSLIDMCSLIIVNYFGLLPYSLEKAIQTGLIMTSVITIGVGFPIAYIIGLAIHDLSLSRDAFLRLSRTDALSGLLNRRAFLEAFDQSCDEVSLVLFDIDRFKSVNDTYGHESGDRVIISVAQSLEAFFGHQNVVARIGGEEFAVLLQGADKARRVELADGARAVIAARDVELADGRIIRVTVSGGMAETSGRGAFGQAFAAADKALYLAKAAGRNRVLHGVDIADLGAVPDTVPLQDPPVILVA